MIKVLKEGFVCSNDAALNIAEKTLTTKKRGTILQLTFHNGTDYFVKEKNVRVLTDEEFKEMNK